jgi:hypothetical protein
MFIVWRKRLITTDRPVELFLEYDRLEKGREVRCAFDVEAWLWERRFCRHTGPERVTWTPLLMHAERVDGKPRQKLIKRFPAIRSCCMADPFLVAGWWYMIGQSIECWEKWPSVDEIETLLIRRDKKAILHKLATVVPRPSRAGLQAFTAYRLEKQAEKDQAEEENRKEREQMFQQLKQEQEEQRRREEEKQRRKEEKERETW